MLEFWLSLEILKRINDNRNYWREKLIQVSFCSGMKEEVKHCNLKTAVGQAKGFPHPQMTHIGNNEM